MKKITVIFAAVAVIASVMSHAQTYTRTNCEVISVRDGIVTADDGRGYAYDFYGDGYTVGEYINLKMNTNGTDNPIDDSVISVVD